MPAIATDAPARTLVHHQADWMVKQLRAATLVVGEAIAYEISDLRKAVWTKPAPATTAGGHVRAFAGDGEPVLMDGSRYVPADVSVPRTFDADGLRQHRKDGNCFVVTSLRVFLAQLQEVAPERLHGLVTPDPADPSQVVVTVAAGTYRVPATLPVDAETGEPRFVTSRDGTTVASYVAKAAAAHFGSWGDIRDGGSPAEVLTWLAGHDAVGDEQILPLLPDDRVLDLLERRNCVIGVFHPTAPLGPNWSDLERLTILPSHAYTSNGVRGRGRRRRIALSNPLGDDPPAMSLADLKELTPLIAWLDPDRL